MKKYKYGHWVSSAQLNPEEAFGFVYLIYDNVNNRGYVGRKQYYSYKKTKRHKMMDWENYTSSSQELNDSIKELGKDKFDFVILQECKTRGGLTYAEANLQHKLDVLTERDSEGNRIFYNKQIGAIKYVPKEFK